VLMPAPRQRCLQSPTPEQRAARRFAASKMTGATRRSFEAEMTLQYCSGDARQAESVCGWGRHTVELGLAERRTGLLCLGAQSACSGRKRWEDAHPRVAEALGQLAESHAQQDPTFRTSLAYTRLTAQGALKALRAQGYDAAQLPASSTMAQVLNRLGLRVRKVVKAKPQKKIKATEAICANIKKRCPSDRSGSRQTLESRLSSDGAYWHSGARWSHPGRSLGL
jgi:Rhodopirellula transposase DDE domain